MNRIRFPSFWIAVTTLGCGADVGALAEPPVHGAQPTGLRHNLAAMARTVVSGEAEDDNSIGVLLTDVLPKGTLFLAHYRKEACR